MIEEKELIYDEDIEDLADRASCLFSSIEGTVPGDRDFGLSPDYIDAPDPIARNIFTMSVMEKTEKYIPQLTIKEVSFEKTDVGLRAVIELARNEDYEEEEDEDE